ncbi:MAG: LysR family transcriptional regulator, partial [Acidimicrobiales bacterium]|nr:LysR family transcriptional regulator [Acidimicrobiales bacterium]
MDSRKLAQFLAVVDHGGFTAAADATASSQPALSIAVRELEAELGTPLFDRVGRRVQLTAAGEALTGPARLVLRDLEMGEAAVGAVLGLEAGSLTLASLPTLAADPLAGLVGRFRQEHPGVVVDLTAPEDTSELLAMVRDGRCEVAVSEYDEPTDDLVKEEIGSQPLWLVLPPSVAAGVVGRRAGGGGRTVVVALAELRDVPFVAAPPGTSTRRLLDEGFAAIGAVPSVAVVTAQRDAIVPLVAAGAGAALVPAALADAAAASGATVARPR